MAKRKKRGLPTYEGGTGPGGVSRTGNPLLDQLPAGAAQWNVGPVVNNYGMQLRPEVMTINPDDFVPKQAIDQPNKQQAAVPKNYKTTARAGTTEDMLNNIQLAATAASFVPVPLISGPARLVSSGIGLYQAKNALERLPEQIRNRDYLGMGMGALDIYGAGDLAKMGIKGGAKLLGSADDLGEAALRREGRLAESNFMPKKGVGPYKTQTPDYSLDDNVLLHPRVEAAYQRNLAAHPEAMKDRATFAKTFSVYDDMMTRMKSPEGFRRAKARLLTPEEHLEEIDRLSKMQFLEGMPGTPASYEGGINALRVNPYMLEEGWLRPVVRHELGHGNDVTFIDNINEDMNKYMKLNKVSDAELDRLAALPEDHWDKAGLRAGLSDRSLSTEYFMDPQYGEANPFLSELQQWGSDLGYMKADKPVTSQTIKKMHQDWKGMNPNTRYPMRMLDILENTPAGKLEDNYTIMASNMNRLQGLLGAGVGLGALGYGMNKQQQAAGGKVKKYAGGGKAKRRGNALDPEMVAISNVLTERNKDLNWVQRGLYPDQYPYIKGKGGKRMTHLLATGEDDEGHYVFPTIIQNEDGTLQDLDPDEAHGWARETNTIMRVPSKKVADFYSRQGLIKHEGGGKVKKYAGGGEAYHGGVLDPVTVTARRLPVAVPESDREALRQGMIMSLLQPQDTDSEIEKDRKSRTGVARRRREERLEQLLQELEMSGVSPQGLIVADELMAYGGQVGPQVGDELDLSPAEIRRLKKLGYEFY